MKQDEADKSINHTAVVEMDKSHSCCKKELTECVKSKKWWPNWIGLYLAIFAFCISTKWNSNIIKFGTWQTSIKESADKETIIGICCLFPVLFCSFALCDLTTNVELKRNELFKHILSHFKGFTVFYFLAIICFMVGSQETMKKYGLGFAIISLVLGIVITNISYCFQSKAWINFISTAAPNGEFYIKCGLVLLATDLKTIIVLGAPGLIIAWIVPPLIIIFMWFFGTKTLKLSDHGFVVSLAAGTAICGVSAICAVAVVVELGKEETALAVSILSFFTIIFMLAVPYIALATNMNKIVAGAWIAGSVDGTGNVVASVGILDDDNAYETATLIKMAQNILIGVVCLIVAVSFKPNPNEIDTDAQESNHDAVPMDTVKPNTIEGNKKEESMNKCLFLWQKFPKFILGYLFLCIIISGFIQPFASETYTKHFMSNIKQLSKWLFCLGFLGIGSTTVFAKLVKQLKDGKSLALYLVGQIVDTFITLLFAWIVVTYIIN